MLAPGKVYYGHSDNIYEIASTLIAKYSWNRYNIATQYAWNRYNTNVETAYRAYDVSGSDSRTTEWFTIFNGVAEVNSTGDYDARYSGDGYYVYLTDNQYINTNGFNTYDTMNLYNLTSSNRSLNFSLDFEDGHLAYLTLEHMSNYRYVVFMDHDRLGYYLANEDYGNNTARLTYTGNHQGEDFNVKIELNTIRIDRVLKRENTYSVVYGNYENNSYGQSYTKQYIRSASDDKYTQGSYIDQVTSNSSNAYPSNDHSGSYWYISAGSKQVQGELIDTVESSDPNTYPDNGILDGYWYVKQS